MNPFIHPTTRTAALEEMKYEIEQLIERHRALRTRYEATCAENRGLRIEDQINKASARMIIRQLQKVIINFKRYDYDPKFKESIRRLNLALRYARQSL